MFSTFDSSQLMNSDLQTAPNLGSLHILVVDEDEAALSACVEIAKTLGYKAEPLANLERLRSTLAQFPTDILLVDIPNRGRGSLEEVAEVHALFPRISIIAMAPVNSATAALAALHCGAVDYLNKPFTMDELASALERAGAGR